MNQITAFGGCGASAKLLWESSRGFLFLTNKLQQFPRARHGKQRHRFREAVDRSAPLLIQQKQNRRNQRSGVTDTDPENEVGDVPGPANRDLISPCADTGGNLITNAKKAKRCNARSSHETHPPPPRRGLFDDAGNTLREPVEIAPV